METFYLVLIGTGLTAVCSFWGWLAVSVVRINSRIAELDQRVNAQDRECNHRLVWMRSIELKVNKVAEDTSFIRGKLEKKD